MNSRHCALSLLLASALALSSIAAPGPAAAAWGPPEIAVQGMLTNLADEPISGKVDLKFSVYASQSGGASLWSEVHPNVATQAGYFDLVLGTINPLDDPPIFEQFDRLWVGISVNNGPELPRAPLSAVGYAMQARHAEFCDGVTGAVAWTSLTGIPGGFADGIDDVGLAVEQDPQVGALGLNKWCASDGSKVNCDKDLPVTVETDPEVGPLTKDKWCASDGLQVVCDKDLPVTVETDPEVGANQANYVSKWNGSALVAGSIYDSGNVGIGTDKPAGRLHVAGGLVWIGLGGAPDYASSGGDAYLTSVLEVDGETYLDGGLTCTALTNTGDLTQQGDSKFEGAATFTENIGMTNKKIEQLAAPTAGTDAANKQYVDDSIKTAVAAIPTGGREKRIYTVLLSLRSAGSCPAGYTVESIDNIKGPDNNLHINLTSTGLFMGGMNGLGYGQAHIYARVPSGQGITTICHKTYTSSTGMAYASVIAPHGGDATVCPTGYNYIPRSETVGNNSWGYMMNNDSGMFIGYIDSWARGSHEYNDQSGFNYRSWTTHISGICYRIFGVDEDPATKNGVYPVFLGIKNNQNCPVGWEVRTVSTVDGENGTLYLQANDNSSVFGGVSDWGHSGNNYMQINFSYSQVAFLCWKFYVRDGFPIRTIRTPHTGNCPNGYESFPADVLKGSNNNGYIGATGHALYMGGLDGWGMHDFSEGYLQHNFTSNVMNKLCLKMENVK